MTSPLDAPPFPVSFLAMILFGLSSMLDSGEHDDITIKQVKDHARTGDLIDFLKSKNGGSFAMNVTDISPVFRKWYTDQMADNCHAMSGRERRKYGVENRGLCLLISYTAEILQQDKAPIELTDHRSPVLAI